MEREEVKELLKRINVSNDKCFDKLINGKPRYNTHDKLLLIDLFFNALKYYDSSDVNKALDNYELENNYAPKPMHLRKELNYMNVKKKYYINTNKKIKYDDLDKVSRQSLTDFLIDTYCPVLNMNISSFEENKKDFILEKANKLRYSIINLVNYIWHYISEIADICNYHIQIAINSLRGQKISNKLFMKEVVAAYNYSENIKDSDVMNKLKSDYAKYTGQK